MCWDAEGRARLRRQPAVWVRADDQFYASSVCTCHPRERGSCEIDEACETGRRRLTTAAARSVPSPPLDDPQSPAAVPAYLPCTAWLTHRRRAFERADRVAECRGKLVHGSSVREQGHPLACPPPPSVPMSWVRLSPTCRRQARSADASGVKWRSAPRSAHLSVGSLLPRTWAGGVMASLTSSGR